MTTNLQPSFLARISPQDIDYTISDFELSKEGAIIHYVIDPSEIIEFCFPVNPLRSARSTSLAKLADDQVALYHVFYIQPERPVLLDEYVYELQSTVMAIKNSFNRGASLINELTDGGKLDILTALKNAEGEDRRRKVEEIISRNLNLILAVAIGSYAEGFSSLEDVCRTRLIADSFLPGDAIKGVENSAELSCIQQAFDESRGSELARAIYEEVARGIEEIGRTREWIEIRKRTAEVDAYAIDRLLAINRWLEDKHAAGKLARRHIFVYLSTTKRAETIFGLPNVRSSLPIVNGRPYGLLRTRQHILLQMIALDETPEKTISNLSQIRDIAEGVRGSSSDTSHNPNEASSPDFEASLLHSYQKKIVEHENKVRNYGLASLLTRLERYKELLSTDDLAERVQGIELLEEVLTDPGFPDIAEMQRSINISLSRFKTDFKNVLLSGLARLSEEYAGTAPFLRRGRDPVIGTGQYMPSNIRLETFRHDYYEILDLAIAFYNTPPQGDEKKARLIRYACKKFLEQDIRQGTVDYTHEFVRTLLFLAVPNPESDSIAYEHAREMVKSMRASRSDGGQMEAAGQFEREFLYVICWAARRACNYRIAYSWANESIELYPDDPRFYHGRSLIVFSWMKEYSGQAHNLSMKIAVDDGEKALALYLSEGSAQSRDAVAALYNSLACYHCFRLDELYDTKKARFYLNQLKRRCDKLTWHPAYPEYFHTEAYVEFEEFRVMWDEGERTVGQEYSVLVGKCREKLLHALEEVRRGASIYRGQEFVMLGEMIEAHLKGLPDKF